MSMCPQTPNDQKSYNIGNVKWRWRIIVDSVTMALYEWMNEWMNERMNERMNEWISPHNTRRLHATHCCYVQLKQLLCCICTRCPGESVYLLSDEPPSQKQSHNLWDANKDFWSLWPDLKISTTPLLQPNAIGYDASAMEACKKSAFCFNSIGRRPAANRPHCTDF